MKPSWSLKTNVWVQFLLKVLPTDVWTLQRFAKLTEVELGGGQCYWVVIVNFLIRVKLFTGPPEHISTWLGAILCQFNNFLLSRFDNRWRCDRFFEQKLIISACSLSMMIIRRQIHFLMYEIFIFFIIMLYYIFFLWNSCSTLLIFSNMLVEKEFLLSTIFSLSDQVSGSDIFHY